MRQRKLLLPIVLTAHLFAAGCGARWTEEQEALVRSRFETAGAASVGGSTSGGVAGAAGPPTQSAIASPQRGPSVPAAAGGTGTSGGAGPASGGAAALPCAAPSSAPGVTDDELSVSTINTLSGPVPGLGASHLAATQAYVAYRNANGGVCGRQVRLLTADDGADAGRNRSLVAELSSSSFALLAGIAAGGDGGVDVINANAIPVVGTAITPLLLQAPTYYGVRPLLPDYNAVTPKYRFLHEQGVNSAAVVYISAASAPDEARRHMQLMQAAGIQVVFEQALPLSTLSYDSAARAVANSRADYLFFLHDQGASASMARSMADTGYQLRFADYIVAYGSNFIDLAGPAAAEGAVSFIDTLPAEDGGVVPEQAAFLEWMAQTAPDTVTDPFAALGWVGAKALFDTLEALPGPIARDPYLAQLAATGTYDAGGLLGPIELSAKQGRGCTVGMIVRDGQWQRLTPDQGFLC